MHCTGNVLDTPSRTELVPMRLLSTRFLFSNLLGTSQILTHITHQLTTPKMRRHLAAPCLLGTNSETRPIFVPTSQSILVLGKFLYSQTRKCYGFNVDCSPPKRARREERTDHTRVEGPTLGIQNELYMLRQPKNHVVMQLTPFFL